MAREKQDKVFGWSPDGGSYVRVGEKIYWSDGYVTDDSLYMRCLEGGPAVHSEDYSAWSSKKRAAIKAMFQKRYKRAADKEKARVAARDALVAQAESKLSENEIMALAEFYRH